MGAYGPLLQYTTVQFIEIHSCIIILAPIAAMVYAVDLQLGGNIKNVMQKKGRRQPAWLFVKQM